MSTLEARSVEASIRGRPRRFAVNLAPAERIGRVLLGLTAVAVGIILLATAGSVPAVVLELVLVAAGVDLVVTGALGHCPLYQRLGRTPRSPRSSS